MRKYKVLLIKCKCTWSYNDKLHERVIYVHTKICTIDFASLGRVFSLYLAAK